jgi:hypothetical protein
MDIRAANTPTSPTPPPTIIPPIPSPPLTHPPPHPHQAASQPARSPLPLLAMTTNLAHPRCAGAGKSCLSLPLSLSPPPPAFPSLRLGFSSQSVRRVGLAEKRDEREIGYYPPRATVQHR